MFEFPIRWELSKGPYGVLQQLRPLLKNWEMGVPEEDISHWKAALLGAEKAFQEKLALYQKDHPDFKTAAKNFEMHFNHAMNSLRDLPVKRTPIRVPEAY